MGLFNEITESDDTVERRVNFNVVLSKYVKRNELNVYYKLGAKLDMKDDKITGLSLPNKATDAASKAFVVKREARLVQKHDLDKIPERFEAIEKEETSATKGWQCAVKHKK